MTFTATLRPCRAAKHTAMLRLTLFPGEAFRVPDPFRRITIWGGAAWVSHAGQDRQMTAGEEMEFDAKRDGAVVSPLGASTLVFEIRRNSHVIDTGSNTNHRRGAVRGGGAGHPVPGLGRP